MPFAQTNDRDRLRAMIAVVLVHAATGYALIAGLAVSLGQPVTSALKLFVPVPPLEPNRNPPPPAHPRAPRQAGAAAPPGLKAKATDIVAPPIVFAQPPPPVAVTLKADTGAAPKSGASDVVAPGTGSGGEGDGPSGAGAPLQQIAGRITGRDYPERPLRAGIGGTLYVRYIVGVKGRVSDCRVVRSSGNAELDETTCRLITQRFRYRPRRDPDGKPIPNVIIEDHSWVVDRAQVEEGVPGKDPDTP